jgi:hypothetical protein
MLKTSYILNVGQLLKISMAKAKTKETQNVSKTTIDKQIGS